MRRKRGKEVNLRKVRRKVKRKVGGKYEEGMGKN